MAAYRFLFSAAVSVAAATVASAASLPAAPAQTAASGLPGVVPMVVNVQAILAQSKASRGLNEQINALRQKYVHDFSQRENDLQQKAQELEKTRNQLAPEVYENKRHDLELSADNVKRYEQQAEQAAQAGVSDSINRIHVVLDQIVGELATQRHATLVLDGGRELLRWAKAYEVTAEAQAQLDQRLPAVKLIIPKSAPAARDAAPAAGQ